MPVLIKILVKKQGFLGEKQGADNPVYEFSQSN